jgi:hypothetical protein
MVLREGVPSLDATKMWNFNSLRRSHFVIISGLRVEYFDLSTEYGGLCREKEVNMLGELAEIAPPYSVWSM